MAYSYTMYIQFHIESVNCKVSSSQNSRCKARRVYYTGSGPGWEQNTSAPIVPIVRSHVAKSPRRSHWGPRWLLRSSKRELSEQEEKIEERKESRGRGECMRTSCQNR